MIYRGGAINMYFNIEKLKKDNKYMQLLGDFIIKEEVCNLSCDYCLSEGSQLKDKHFFQRKDGKLNYRLDLLDELRYEDGYKLKEEIDKGLKIYNHQFDAPIMKFSGGEVLLIKNFIELLKIQSENYEVLQILTNGTLFDKEFVGQLKLIHNVNIQFSIDGHTLQMNKNRIKNEVMNKKLMDNLKMLVDNDITTEVYCVVSKTNIDYIPDFIEYLLENFGSKVHLVLFPVRQSAAALYMPEPDKLQGIEAVLNNYDKYKSILPPIQYLQEMYDYMKTGIRKSRCYVPLVMFQNFDDGIITPCPNCWTTKLGNIVENTNEVISRIGSDNVYNLMTNNPPITKFCQKCFADYHLFNLYFNDIVEMEDLARTRPLLQGDKVQERLREIKQILKENTFPEKDLKRYVRK